MTELINIELNRTKDNIKKIFFIKEGNSPWYRAYELSAYYAVNYNNGLRQAERLQANRKPSKLLNDGVIQIGLQLSSFKKYFPNAELCNVTDKYFTINIESGDFADVTLDNYQELIKEWKGTFELKNKKPSKKEPLKTIYNSPVSFTGIMKEIIRFDTYDKNETDLRNFINALKEMCANLI